MTRFTPVKRLQIWDTAPGGTRGWREALHGEDGVFPPSKGRPCPRAVVRRTGTYRYVYVSPRRGPHVLCQQDWPFRQQDWPFRLKEPQTAHCVTSHKGW